MGIAYRLYTYDHDPSVSSYGLEAAESLGTAGSVVLKTLIADLGSKLVVGVVPVEDELDLRALAHHLGAKRATLARPGDAERSSGYVLGGISPLGQRRRLTTVIDQSVEDLPTCFVSAGRRGFEVELAPKDLATATNATFASIRRPR
jgi:Cys-tRNA(Pro)/Cys-tRNA(Cys) deacylase